MRAELILAKHRHRRIEDSARGERVRRRQPIENGDVALSSGRKPPGPADDGRWDQADEEGKFEQGRRRHRGKREAGVNAHVRKSRGRDISAACGQLRREQVRAEEEVKFDAGAGVALPVIA